jgi:hypothetical protein
MATSATKAGSQGIRPTRAMRMKETTERVTSEVATRRKAAGMGGGEGAGGEGGD